MTKWTDPIDNPEQNARYWREQNARDWIFAAVICGGYIAFLIALLAGWLP